MGPSGFESFVGNKASEENLTNDGDIPYFSVILFRISGLISTIKLGRIKACYFVYNQNWRYLNNCFLKNVVCLLRKKFNEWVILSDRILDATGLLCRCGHYLCSFGDTLIIS